MDISDDITKQIDATTVPGQLNRYNAPNGSLALREISLEELAGELLTRIHKGAFDGESQILLGCQIQNALRVALNVHCNRMSKQRYRDMFDIFYRCWGPSPYSIQNATILDLGCGSVNPYGILFLFLMLGAKRGIAVDMDGVQEVSRAVQAMADCAGMMLVDPEGVVSTQSIPPAHILQNIASFDLARLSNGDPSGIDTARLCFRQESSYTLSLNDGEADLVISNTFLEHVDHIDKALGELARVTRKGGFGVHVVDGADHRRYWDPSCHSLKFLEEPTTDRLLHGSNRVRPTEFVALFKRHGFEVVAFMPFETIEVPTKLRDQFVEPFRSMSTDVLSVIGARLLVRKV